MRFFSRSAAVILLVAFAGCSAHQAIDLAGDGSGMTDVEIRLDPAFAAYIADLNVALGAAEDTPLFDPVAIERAFARWPGLDLERAESVEPYGLDLTISFDSVDALIEAAGARSARFVRFEQTAEFARLAVEVDRTMLRALLALVAVDPVVIDTFVPEEESLSAAEYRDYVGWALEEYATERPLAEVLRASTVESVVRPNGEIIQLRGGRRRDGSALFTTPLVEVASGERAFDYVVVFTRTEPLVE